ncbi:hypothetical protein WAI453_011866 [Rhynchosporium graminicola]
MDFTRRQRIFFNNIRSRVGSTSSAVSGPGYQPRVNEHKTRCNINININPRGEQKMQPCRDTRGAERRMSSI